MLVCVIATRAGRYVGAFARNPEDNNSADEEEGDQDAEADNSATHAAPGTARTEEKNGKAAEEISPYLVLVCKGKVKRREGFEGRGMGGNVECEEKSDECGGRMR